MAKDLNKVMLIGRLGRDPELKYTDKGIAYCSFSMATDESYKNDSGQKVEKTEWHNIVAWRKLAEICSQYLKKGSKIYAEGKLQTTFQEKDGEKKYYTKIVLSDMSMLDSKPGGGTAEYTGKTDVPNSVNDILTPSGGEDDDLPF